MLLKKTTANQRVCRAARKGLLPVARKLRCTDCGKRARDYDHYAGYEARNALVVQPVCRSCHIKREYKRGERKVTSKQRKISKENCIRFCHTEEARRKSGLARLGKPLTAAHRESISKALLGREIWWANKISEGYKRRRRNETST